MPILENKKGLKDLNLYRKLVGKGEDVKPKICRKEKIIKNRVESNENEAERKKNIENQ